MEKQKTYWIKFWSPGSFVANEYNEPCSAIPDPADVEFPDHAYAFTLHEREDIIDGDNTYTGEAKKIGPIYYHPNSVVETLEMVKKNPNASATLISNMTCNEWKEIIWSRWGNWPQPFYADQMTVIRP